MPRGDGTGPMGMGPMTGRGAGYCAGHAMPGYANPGRGFGMGFGRGRGYRRMFCAAGVPGRAWGGYGFTNHPAGPAALADERTLLSSQVEYLENQLKYMRDRLKDLGDKD